MKNSELKGALIFMATIVSLLIVIVALTAGLVAFFLNIIQALI